jgi:hypothetical protein
MVLRHGVAVPAHQGESRFGVEEEKRVSAHWAQGMAWPPPRRSGGLRCRPLGQTRAILPPSEEVVKVIPGKFTLNLLEWLALVWLMKSGLFGTVPVRLCTVNAKDDLEA